MNKSALPAKVSEHAWDEPHRMSFPRDRRTFGARRTLARPRSAPQFDPPAVVRRAPYPHQVLMRPARARTLAGLLAGTITQSLAAQACTAARTGRYLALRTARRAWRRYPPLGEGPTPAFLVRAKMRDALAAARAFKQQTGKRSVLFINHGSEERGPPHIRKAGTSAATTCPTHAWGCRR